MATQGVILNMALKYAIENKEEFEYSNEYLDNLINKMKIKIALSDKSVQELFDELEINVVGGITNKDYDKPINDIMDVINDNEQLTNILGNINYEDLKPIIEAHLKRSEYDINNLSDIDKSKIIESVLMEYL